MIDFRIAGAATALLLLATPVIAQTGDSPSSAAGRSGSQSQASVPMAQGAQNTAMDDNMSCQSMMDKASSMQSTLTASSKKTAAMKEMRMAKKAMAAGDEKSCKTHTRTAMDDMSVL